jgi:hypothetical protein
MKSFDIRLKVARIGLLARLPRMLDHGMA